MTAVAPCLVFVQGAEEAARYYVSLFKDSRVVEVQRSEGNEAFPKGAAMHVEFELDGQRYTAFDGGEHFRFSEAFSIVASCQTQAEIDTLWEKLLADGGRESQCGWLVDRWGLSWQIIPESIGKMLTDAASGNTAKAMAAMLRMRKLDIATLEAAYRS
ncbi:MAG TPA: VOC family protein [Candidatus Limnocylindria bacterium]|nr:VOC family protein [Candidatus Limnocylindria bacterium]